MINIKAGYIPNKEDVVDKTWFKDGDLVIKWFGGVFKTTRLNSIQTNLTEDESYFLKNI